MATEKGSASAGKVEENKELAPAAGTELSTADAFFEDAGVGMEDFSQSDFTVPFISIIQALSKAVQKNHGNYVQGAEQGQFLNSATRKTYDGDKGIFAVPVYFQHRYIAWKPNNGGIAHDYGNDPTVYDSLKPNEKYQRIDAEGNEVVDAMEYFVYLFDEEAGTVEAAVIPFSGTQYKKGKGWNNLIRAHAEIRNGKPVKPALYFYAYKLTTGPESNDKGSWYGYKIEDYKKLPDMGDLGAQIFNEAKTFRASIVAGEIKAATEAPEATGAGDGDGAF
jgi:hypothetical protein